MKNENIVKGFSHKTYNLIYMVGVVKSPTQITKDDEDIILSEENLKKSVIAIAKDQTFLSYKNGLTINGMSSAYLEYMTNVTPDTKSYIRQYFIVFKNYLLTISFTVPKQSNGTLGDAKTKFDNYKSFFSLAANTLTITK